MTSNVSYLSERDHTYWIPEIYEMVFVDLVLKVKTGFQLQSAVLEYSGRRCQSLNGQ